MSDGDRYLVALPMFHVGALTPVTVNVYPAEIVNVVLSHPEVSEVAVIGQPSDKWGESPFAVVVKKEESLTETDLVKFCEGKLARLQDEQ